MNLIRIKPKRSFSHFNLSVFPAGGTALSDSFRACCAVPDRYEISGADRRRVSVDPENQYTLVACGTLFRTGTLRRVGGFHPFFWEEYDLYLRLKPLGSFIHVAQPLYLYRKHAGGMTHSDSRRRAGWRELAKAWGSDALRAAGSHPELELVLS